MRLLTTFILSTICLTVMAQTSPTRTWVDTEVKYTDSYGKVIMVYNSLPKGGGGYIDLAGEKYSYVIFWTRVVNDSPTPLDLVIKFPADSLAIFPSPDSYLRIFLPLDTMTLDKIPLGDYGLNNLQSSANAGFDKPGTLQRTLKFKEECFFYILVLIHQARGTARAALVLKGQDLFYKISIDPQSALIPCGHLVFKN
jgi:hypothetical protein